VYRKVLITVHISCTLSVHQQATEVVVSNVVEFFGGNRFTDREREEFERLAAAAPGWTDWEFASTEDGTEYVSIWTGGEYASLALQKAQGELVVISERGAALRRARSLSGALAGFSGLAGPMA
jgi:hypothetical protein